jgi:NADH:ubiquinone oxidoreductase subunit 5 (subunit L)/multisubunit Na+/H+ antiporter MnhA subunit
MTVPLLVLAAGSVLVGFIGFPPDNGLIHAFLRPAVETAHGVVGETGTNWPEFLALAAGSTTVGIVGILIGLSMYARGRPDPAAVSRAAGPYYDVLVNKYYVDDLYDRKLVDVAKAFAGAAWAFDIHIIDGLVNRLGWAIKLGGGGLRRAQTGVVGNYALSIVAGLLVIMVVYGGYATGWLHR